MYNAKDYTALWQVIVERFNARGKGDKPKDLIASLIGDYTEELVKETFAAVVKIKAWDGRISGWNRKWAECIEVDPTATEMDANNYFYRKADLDAIHTANIDLLITELRRAVI